MKYFHNYVLDLLFLLFYLNKNIWITFNRFIHFFLKHILYKTPNFFCTSWASWDCLGDLFVMGYSPWARYTELLTCLGEKLTAVLGEPVSEVLYSPNHFPPILRGLFHGSTFQTHPQILVNIIQWFPTISSRGHYLFGGGGDHKD